MMKSRDQQASFDLPKKDQRFDFPDVACPVKGHIPVFRGFSWSIQGGTSLFDPVLYRFD